MWKSVSFLWLCKALDHLKKKTKTCSLNWLPLFIKEFQEWKQVLELTQRKFGVWCEQAQRISKIQTWRGGQDKYILTCSLNLRPCYMTAWCHALSLWGIYGRNDPCSMASPLAIIRLVGRKPDTELKRMWEDRIICIHACTGSEELVLLMCLLGVNMIHL